MVHVLDEDGHALTGDPAREPPPQWNPHPLLDLLLDSLRRAGHELL